ncbi:MAG: hypothetical protein SFU25_12060 [Candidatus Caenarcaniphilales bacterium]|nr:hypothetical protein [Candidatus Caenarcaniphilales bacterium]
MPYQLILFGALGLYLWRLSKRNAELGQDGNFRLNIDTDKMAATIAPWVPINPVHRDKVEGVLRETANAILHRVRR